MTTTDGPTGVLAAVALDAADPEPEANFWRDLLGLEVIWRTGDFVALRGAAVLITVQRVDRHQPPTWPADDIAKQIHLEVSVTDLDDAERSALAMGAVRAAQQPRPDKWRVLIDPAGHPFCVSNQIPAP